MRAGRSKLRASPSCRSIIVNLEHIKAIITVDKVLVVNYGQDENGTKVCGGCFQRGLGVA